MSRMYGKNGIGNIRSPESGGKMRKTENVMGGE